MANQSPLKCEVINDIKELTPLSNEWSSLNNAVEHSTLFNSPYW